MRRQRVIEAARTRLGGPGMSWLDRPSDRSIGRVWTPIPADRRDAADAAFGPAGVVSIR